MLKNKEMADRKTEIEKYMGPAAMYGSGACGVAQDFQYISDLNEDGISHLYELLHNEYDKAQPNKTRPDQITPYLRSELCLRLEANIRHMKLPKLKDMLTEAFDNLLGSGVRKAEDGRTYDAETTKDPVDEHLHVCKGLSEDGMGATEEAGNPPHTHNVQDFMVLPVEIDGYKSEHPGKVLIHSKKAIKVTKSHPDGSVDWEMTCEFRKTDEDKQIVYGIVYEPDVVDAQNDSAGEDEIEKACHHFMIKSRTLGVMHEKMLKSEDSVIVENYIAPISFVMGSQIVRKGSWVQAHKVFSKDLWKGIKEEKYTGFSMAGRARDLGKPFGKKDTTEADIVKNTSLIGIRVLLSKKSDIEKVIREVGGKYCVMTADGGRRLGCHDDRESALKQLIAIEANKHLTAKHLSETNITKVSKTYVSRDQMAKICTRCHGLMKRKKIHKVSVSTITDRNKFKRMFGVRRSSSGHDGLCRKFCTDPTLFVKHLETKD